MQPDLSDVTKERKGDMSKTEAEHLAKAAEHYAAREESFQRCDTDGFVSQWASGIMGDKERAAAKIAAEGGTAEFQGLYRKSDGKRVRAKLRQGEYGYYWAFCDANDKFTGRFLTDSKGTPRSKMFKEGFEVRTERAPAEAFIDGRGYGLSGSAWASVRRTDGGYPPDAVVV